MLKKLNYFSLLAYLLTSAVSSSVNASEDLTDEWYMPPRLNIQSAQNTQLLLNNKSIMLGHALNKRINLEINLLSEDPSIRSNNYGVALDGKYYLQKYGQFSPYIAGGISRLKNDQLNSNYEEQITNIGLGFKHTLKGNGARILADVRYFIDDNQNNNFNPEATNDWALSLGVSIPLSIGLFK